LVHFLPQTHFFYPSITQKTQKTNNSNSQSEVHKIITTRDKKCANFVEFRNYKLIYRRYASLYFSFCLDVNDNELLYLETVHLFVELLDKFFESVCELDLVFHFHKVYALMDEMFLAGEVQESSKRVILDRINELAVLTNK
jgi:AP-2 complex subunit sigma-1